MSHIAVIVSVAAGLMCGAAGGAPPPVAIEALAPRFSVANTAAYLDAGARAREEKCTTCHGTLAYLLARPALSVAGPKLAEIRSGLEKFSAELEALQLDPGSHPRRIAQTVMTAAALAHQDAATSAKLQPVTRRALDRMWQVQQPDGGYQWLKPNAAPPSAVEDHFGVTMAAIAVGWAPENYRDTPAARAGLEKTCRYLRQHPPQHMHQRAMLLLADHYVGGLLDEAARRKIVSDMFALQRPDGGWAMASLGRWTRKDGTPQDLTTSDGYGTGFALYVLRTAGPIPPDDARMRRAVEWLKTHQRAGGGWYTRSPRSSDELSSYLGTVYAVLALDACGELRARSADK